MSAVCGQTKRLIYDYSRSYLLRSRAVYFPMPVLAPVIATTHPSSLVSLLYWRPCSVFINGTRPFSLCCFLLHLWFMQNNNILKAQIPESSNGTTLWPSCVCLCLTSSVSWEEPMETERSLAHKSVLVTRLCSTGASATGYVCRRPSAIQG